MASRADIMRLLKREVASEGGAMVGGRRPTRAKPRGRGMVGGCDGMLCQACQGSGLVGGRILGLASLPGMNKIAQREALEERLIDQAVAEAGYKALKTKKEKSAYVKRRKYELAGLTPPVYKPRAGRVSKRPELALLREWRSAVSANPECVVKPQCRRLGPKDIHSPAQIAELEQMLKEYYEDE
jgi:hypothetical protein